MFLRSTECVMDRMGAAKIEERECRKAKEKFAEMNCPDLIQEDSVRPGFVLRVCIRDSGVAIFCQLFLSLHHSHPPLTPDPVRHGTCETNHTVCVALCRLQFQFT